MGIVKKLWETGKSKALTAILAGTLFFTSFGCGVDIGDSKHHEEQETEPPIEEYFIPDPLPEFIENHPAEFKIVFSDPEENYPLNFSLDQGPSGMIISPYDEKTALVQWTPTSSQVLDVPIYALFSVVDSSNTEGTTSLWINNITETQEVPLKVASMEDSSSLENILATITHPQLGDIYSWTGSDGKTTILGVPEGQHPIIFKDDNASPLYETYKAGLINVTSNNLEKTALMIPISRTPLIDDILRQKGYTAKWEVFPDNNIYAQDSASAEMVNPAIPEAIKNKMINHLTNDTHTFTDSNIDIIDYAYSLPDNGQFFIGFDMVQPFDMDYGVHPDNGCVKMLLRFPYPSEPTDAEQLHYLMRGMIGGGYTSDPSYSHMVFYNDGSTPLSVTAPTPDDDFLIRVLYNSIDPRPNGNKDLGTEDNHDVNPQDKVWK